MKKLLGGFAAMLTVLTLQAELVLVDSGRSDYRIGLAADATPVEKSAADELRNFVAAATGVTLPVVVGLPEPAGKTILVGRAAEAAGLLAENTLAGLPTDAILLRTAGDALILAGGAPRGTLYAVYEFLEKECGIRFWTSRETFVPRREKLAVGPLDIEYAPPLISRESFYHDVIDHPQFASRLRCNGHFEQLDESLGGHYEIIGWCHTFPELIPAEKYLAAHPEWFAEVDGKRVATQLCLTNPDLRRELTANVLAKLRAHPAPAIISVSQNDSGGEKSYCQCADCRAVDEAEGSPAGSLLLAVNEVADAVAREFPGVLVETLAYRHTRKAPRSIRPAPNVLIRLCSIECDFSKPIDSEANASFRDDVLNWSEIATQLAIWNYVTNFSNYLIPHPNLTNLGNDIRFFADHRVTALFEQGDYQSGGIVGDFVALRAWLLAKLMWDPSQDQTALIDEFLTGYYGEAAPFLKEYLALLEQEVAQSGIAFGCYHANTERWLRPATIIRAQALLNQAARAVAADPAKSERVRIAALPMELVELERRAELKLEDDAADRQAAKDRYLKAMRQYQVQHCSEGSDFSRLETQLKQ